MGIKRIIDTDFWKDDKVIEEFSPEDKLFMVYLLTNPHTTQLGIYHINKKIMAFELGYSKESVTVLLERFETKYKLIRYSKETNEIAIKNYLKHSIIKGGKPVEDLLYKELAKVKDRTLIDLVFNHLSKTENLNKTILNILNTFNYKKDNDIYNDNDNEVSYNDSYHDSSDDKINKDIVEIVDYLNETVGRDFKHTTPKTQTLLKALLKSYSIQEIKLVIEFKNWDWTKNSKNKNNDMSQYLRPETLFNFTKFEGYLNTAHSTLQNDQQNNDRAERAARRVYGSSNNG